ncbi:MAG: U32 family peptidase [Clostridiales bacterium]|nr:U32 family peptidase [Clostridiales bacterium]
MEKIELLAPVGDEKTFYTAIKSGANAVYLGLHKFNARMKAENISLDNIERLVSFAHLKKVKVYVVINILLSDNEFTDMCQMVGKCYKASVDGFIVQDLGVISVLRRMYPNIVLHGSTQLAVHNVRGARVAKEMGLSRIVLSREATLKDIEEIKNNVDIELEVFVHGAMCVGFSGNCYLSSIKCGASGNRGECKQLCRLPYTLSDGKKIVHGYAISPRDNCMLSYLDKLIKLGVSSLKIEGRLRNENYVSITTTIYRDAIDEIYSTENIVDIDKKLSQLKEVFSRGDYVSGYNDGNNVINTLQNNHLGKNIGKVISCNRFKDIYKITIKSSEKLSTGDGIKFVLKDNSVISMGVGNIEYSGNNIIVYGKNHISNDSNVYISKSSSINKIDKSFYRNIDFDFVGLVGNKLQLTIKCGEYSNTVYGDVVEVAKKNITSEETIISQLSKVNKDIYKIGKIDIAIDDGFISLSAINDLRRKAIEELVNNILGNNKNLTIADCDMPTYNKLSSTFSSLAIVDENSNIPLGYDALILSPTSYNLDVISSFKNKYDKKYKSKLIINLPCISRYQDLSIIDEIVEQNRDAIFIANNIFALDYLKDGVEIWAGSGLNITNNYTVQFLKSLGVKEFISSIEKWSPTISGSYKIISGKYPLMTMVSCPIKTLYNNNCDECKWINKSLSLKSTSNYSIRRFKISNCYFEVLDNISSRDFPNKIVDLRD